MMNLPDFQMNDEDVPTIKLKTLRLQEYKGFEDYTFDFSTEEGCQKFACFFGPNGCGKTTVLEAIQLVFTRFEGRDERKLQALLGKSVRHKEASRAGGIYGDDDFLITAQMESSMGDYEVRINKKGFLKTIDPETEEVIESWDHPEEIKQIVYRLCYFARFDQELHQFSLARDKWEIFSELFYAVTGFEVEEQVDLFSNSADPVQNEITSQYVLGFNVKKPNETIGHKECSAGERKIIKSFSTLLNKEYTPSVMLVDNVAMHVETGRHIDLVESMKRCFPDSQIFATTHSYQISRNFGDKSQLYDLRLMYASDLLQEQPWRLYFADELRDSLSKLKAMSFNKDIVGNEIIFGEKLLRQLLEDDTGSHTLQIESENFFKRTTHLFTIDISKYYYGKRGASNDQK